MEPSEKQFRKRNAILSCLVQSPDHPSAEMIFQLLQKEQPDISLATVYRNLAWFRNHGMVQCLGSVNGAERFDACMEPHAHFICTHCGAVMDLPGVSLPMDTASLIEAEIGARVDGCQLTYHGLCGSCKSVVPVETDPQ